MASALFEMFLAGSNSEFVQWMKAGCKARQELSNQRKLLLDLQIGIQCKTTQVARSGI